MSDIEKINLFKTLFYVSLVTAIVFFVLSIILFFVFKIPQLYMMRTGRAQKKSIEQMKKINSETGRLESASSNHKKGMSQIFGNSAQLDASSKTALLMDYNVAGTSVPEPQVSEGKNETEVLSGGIPDQNKPPEAAENGIRASETIGETVVLSSMNDVADIPSEKPKDQELEPDTSYGAFDITRHIIEIHTDENIA